MKHANLLREAFSKQPIFSIADAKRLLRGASAAYLHLLLHNLKKRGEVFRISRGIYSFSSDSSSVGFAFRPFYYGCQNALSIHGLWEQETNPVVITVRKVRSGLRSYAGSNYVVRRISRKMFFGYETVKYSGIWVPVSTIEKTIIDLAYFRQHIPHEVLAEARKRIDWKKMDGFLKKCPKALEKRVEAEFVALKLAEEEKRFPKGKWKSLKDVLKEHGIDKSKL